MKTAGKLLLAGGIMYGIARMSKREKSKTKRGSGGSVVIIDEDPVIDEVVPAPSDAEANVVQTGGEYSPQLDIDVDWWVSEYDGGFGWQYIVKQPGDADGEMSYLDGVIYHYTSFEDAFGDLVSIIR